MPIDPLTIVFALLALVVVWKLRSVLGEGSGFQKPRKPVAEPKATEPGKPRTPAQNVIRLPSAAKPQLPQAQPADPDRWHSYAVAGSPVATGLDAIASADPTFSGDAFVEGAKIAYEAIITAFAASERKTLQSLLAKEVYEGFNAALLDRDKRKERLTTTFVSMDGADIESATLDGRISRISVRFLSKQISATHAADGSLIDGSADRVFDMNDIWTFARDVTARDPNWKLVATEAGH